MASRRDDSMPPHLFPEEALVVDAAVPARRAEFATGRACARQALAQLGVPSQALPKGVGGAPQWPAGTVGSITHCTNYRACAVASSDQFSAIGVDAEPNEPLRAGLLTDIATGAERSELAVLTMSDPSVSWDRLLFCAKEAIYKIWFPLMESWLGFDDAEVRFECSRGLFEGRLVGSAMNESPPWLTRLEGRWAAREDLLLAAIALPSPVRDSS